MFKDWKFGEFFLLLSQFFERIAHYSITANIIMMLISSPLCWKNYNAIAAPFLLNGFCFISSMAGGILSDTYLRKTTTVIIGYGFYITYIGFPYIFWSETISTLCRGPHHKCHGDIDYSIINENCACIILPSIIFSSIGSGLIRSVVASMGADMVNNRWENPSVFFSLYYWCLNGGSLIAFLGFSLLQQNVSRRWGYVAPTTILAMSFISFMLGGPYYVHNKKPQRSTVAMIFKIYSEACKKKLAVLRQKPREKKTESESQENIFARVHASSLFNDESDIENEYPDYFSSLTKENTSKKSDSYTYPKLNSINRFDGQATSSSIVESDRLQRTDNVSFLDRCQIRYGGSFKEQEVQDVRRFTFIMNILLFMIPYYMIYFQMESTYMYQGVRMNVGFGHPTSKFNIPASWLIVLDIILLMFLLPFLAKVVYPWLRSKKLFIRQTSRIIVGFIFVAISVICAGAIETKRLRVVYVDKHNISQTIDNYNYTAADMSVFFQVPQYIAMGFSESLAVVAGLELACTQVSGSMQGLANGLFWFASGLGSFCGSGTLYIFKQITFPRYYNCSDNNLDCHLNIYFFGLAGIICAILLIQILYLYKFRHLERTEQNQLLMRRVSL